MPITLLSDLLRHSGLSANYYSAAKTGHVMAPATLPRNKSRRDLEPYLKLFSHSPCTFQRRHGPLFGRITLHRGLAVVSVIWPLPPLIRQEAGRCGSHRKLQFVSLNHKRSEKFRDHVYSIFYFLLRIRTLLLASYFNSLQGGGDREYQYTLSIPINICTFARAIESKERVNPFPNCMNISSSISLFQETDGVATALLYSASLAFRLVIYIARARKRTAR